MELATWMKWHRRLVKIQKPNLQRGHSNLSPLLVFLYLLTTSLYSIWLTAHITKYIATIFSSLVLFLGLLSFLVCSLMNYHIHLCDMQLCFYLLAIYNQTINNIMNWLSSACVVTIWSQITPKFSILTTNLNPMI